MATQDNNNPGLLSRVAKFVRNPTTDWADLNKAGEPSQNDQGKQALKDMIERKRHDDAVRKREFDYLRKLRTTSVSMHAVLAEGASSFRSSRVDIESAERATTLKKIDEIEADMSQQWWKGRSGAVATAPAGAAEARLAGVAKGPATNDNFPVTAPAQLQSEEDDAPTQMAGTLGFEYLPTQVGKESLLATGNEFELSARSVFSSSKMVTLDMGRNLLDPEMEEAAIRYANGDDAGAEATLKAALSDAAASADKVDGWAIALFDFYRCTSQQDAFERWALEYADTFGRSAPSWVPPGQTVVENRRHAPVVGSSAAPGTVSWECPAALDEVAVSRLRDLVQVNAKSCQIRWGRLQTMSAPAARLLASVLAQWCEQPMILSFEGITTLKQLLQVQTPTGDPKVAESWWKLRLECLRMLRLTEDYELVALDFCVTFEVSPPPWCEPRCQCVTAQLSGAPNAPSALAGQPKDLLTATQSVASPLELRRSQGLSGEVTGDAHEVVAALQKRPVVQGVLLVDCAHLIRVDFSAAGSLLNWVANEQAKGKFVEFRDVPRLVAAFFNLIGINEHARVMSRNN